MPIALCAGLYSALGPEIDIESFSKNWWFIDGDLLRNVWLVKSDLESEWAFMVSGALPTKCH